jgi:hypothetical protein
MQDSNIPSKFPIPWANSAGGTFIRAIPTASQIGIVPGAASLTDGWPPLDALPVAGGGIPPDIRDQNGILNAITAWCRWQQAGGATPYDATFQTAIGGYPKGAVVASVTTLGLFWFSTADNNVTNPDTGGAGWVAFPNHGMQVFAASGTFTVPAGVTRIKVRVWGGGGGGGGALNNLCAAIGGSAGGYAEGTFSVTPGATYTVTIGGGGPAGATLGGNGSAGGTTGFGPLLSATGGGGGSGASSGVQTVGTGSLGTGTGGALNLTGLPGEVGFITGNTSLLMGGGGGASPFFAVLTGSVDGAGPSAANPGCGGGGASAAAAGGAGAAGLAIVEW